MSLIYITALVLNPGYCIRYIKTHQPKKWLKLILAKVKKLQEKYREEIVVLPTTLAFLYNNPSYKLLELNYFNQIALSLYVVAQLASKDKYKDYNLLESCDPSKKGALAWWCQDTQRQQWPRLSLMAINILLIPPMSDKPERVFLGACCTVSWDRGQIEPETIKMRECLKHQKRSRILDTFFEDQLGLAC